MRIRQFMIGQLECLITQLHQSVSPEARFRFVNVAYWASEEAFEAAVARQEFRSIQSASSFNAGLYRTIVPQRATR